MDRGFTGVGLMPNLGDARIIERLRGKPINMIEMTHCECRSYQEDMIKAGHHQLP